MAQRARRGRVDDVRGVSRLLAVGDVQSSYGGLAATLERAGYLAWDGESPRWTAGDAALLFIGDLVDKGEEPSDVLLLVQSLDAQAEAAGGCVVLVQGNHELMLLAALGDGTGSPAARSQWFGNGGLETLARLAHSQGAAVPERILQQIYTPSFGDLPVDAPEVEELVALVRVGWAGVLGFLERRLAPAALVNGAVLAFHGSPNYGAHDLESFASDERELAWGRAWLVPWELGEPAFAERVADLKRQLDRPSESIEIRHVLFGHTQQQRFEVPGFRGRQFRIGRLLAHDPARELPGVYNLITCPTGVPRGGALGALEFGAEGIQAVYGSEIENDHGRWPARESLGPADPAFRGSS
jgi:hypothetical protein